MKIGVDIRIFGTSHGGIGRYGQKLLPEILKLDQTNEYFLFTHKNTVDTSELSGLKEFKNAHIVETTFRHYSVGEQYGFLRMLNYFNLDLVHFLNFNVPMLYNKPFVVTIHDLVHHKISGAKRIRLTYFYAYKKIIESAAQKSRAIITVSEQSKMDIVKILRVPEQKITVTYEGVSLNSDVSRQRIEEAKKNYYINKPYFLFVGVLERKKNLVNLTRGFDLFLKKYKLNVDLVIVGKADRHYPEIRQQALDIQHRDNLVFTGYVQDSELEALYAGAYAFVNASLHEGFGLPGVEALQFGLPLLVSNTEVFNEIYDNAAVYFNPADLNDIADKLYLILRDSQFYEQMQQKAFNRSQMFDWGKTASETLKVYKSVLNNYAQNLL